VIGAGIRGALAAVVLAMSAAGPALAEPRGITLQPGSGIVKRDRPPRRRDAARQADAQAKRERKNAKRYRDWIACYVRARSVGFPPGNGPFAKFANGVSHGK